MTTPRNDGLDLSNHQAPAEIVWSQVPLYPLMAHKATEGRTFRDRLFVDRWRLFGERGHRWRGAYHWIRSDSPMAAQVANFTATIEAAGWDQLRPGEFIQLDWETTPGIPNVTPAMVDEWLDLCRARWGDRVIVYSSGWVPGFQEWRKANPGVPLWYAAYPATPAQEVSFRGTVERYEATIWQWTSTASVPGIAEGVDANEVLRPDALDRLALLQPVPIPPKPTLPPLVPVADPKENPVATRILFKGWKNQWLVGAGTPLHLTPELAQRYRDVPLVECDPHPQAMKAILHQSGLTEADLVKG